MITIKIYGILPGHRASDLPESEGVLISFTGEPERVLEFSEVKPTELEEITAVDNLREYAKGKMKEKTRSEKWGQSFCFIKAKKNDFDTELVAQGLRLHYQLSFPDKENLKKLGLDIRLEFKIEENGWKLMTKLPILNLKKNRSIGRQIWI